MLSKIKRRLSIPVDNEENDLLLMDLIEQSENFICLYLSIPAIEDVRLNSIVQSLSIDLFNRMGEEGKTTSIYSDYRSDFPDDLLTPYLGTLNSIRAQIEAEKEAERATIIRFI